MPLRTPALSPHVTQDSSISEASLQLEEGEKGCPHFPLSQGAGPLGVKARQTQTRRQSRKESTASTICICPCVRRHTAQFLGACQAGLLSGTVCLWGDGCLEWEGEKGLSGGGEQGSAPDQAVRLGSNSHGMKPPGKGYWNQQPAHPLSAGSEVPTSPKTSGNRCLPSPQGPSGPR